MPHRPQLRKGWHCHADNFFTTHMLLRMSGADTEQWGTIHILPFRPCLRIISLSYNRRRQ